MKKDNEMPMEPESTKVLYSDEETLNTTLKTFASIKLSLDGCWDHKSPYIHTTVNPLWDALVELKHKGIRLRCVTEITPENISYCKKVMEIAELRHMAGIKVNFGIADGRECLLHGTIHNEQSLSQAIVTNAKGIVQAHQNLLESIWNKAISSNARIKEIENLPNSEFSKGTVKKDEIQKISFDLVGSADQEILLIFSSNQNPKHPFWLFEQGDYPDSKFGYLLKKALDRGVKIRILLPYSNLGAKEDQIKQTSEGTKYGGNISIKYLAPSLQSQTTTTLIIDRKLCLTVETTKEETEEIKIATHTNSEYTIWSYISVFETLWIKTNIIKT
jgi:hypothetical protein